MLLEGNLYCPAILANQRLLTATHDHRNRKQDDPEFITRASWQSLIEQRTPYLAKRNGKPRPDGSCRFMCPAAGAAPTVTCPLRQRDDVKAGLRPIPWPALPADDMRGGACLGAGNVTMNVSERFPRYFMDVQFGSKDWVNSYQSARQSIESANSVLKDCTWLNADKPDRRRVRGLAAVTLFTACMVTVMNIRKLDRWMKTPVSVDKRGRGPEKPEKRQKRRRDLRDGWGRSRFGPKYHIGDGKPEDSDGGEGSVAS